MEKVWLEAQLAAGRSIEDIAREVGKDARTVGYWVRKHGLRSQHAERHAPRGGVDEGRLRAMAAAGMSIRAIAAELDVSYTTVRHWLRRYEISTNRARTLADTAAARGEGADEVFARCPRHGLTLYIRTGGSFRCRACRSESVTTRRRRVKALLVAEAGGACADCGFAGSQAALQFHHVDPTQKSFALSHEGVTRSLDAARAEAGKCILLCANCHAIAEARASRLPFPTPDSRSRDEVDRG